MNYARTSTGEKVSEATIQKRLSDAYKEYYVFEPKGACEGCGRTGVCTAHIIPKARCKQLNKTELIWSSENWFRACYSCNGIAENPSSESIKELYNYHEILAVVKKYDPETYQKMI